MPRTNSSTWSTNDQITAARLQDFNEDLDDIYTLGHDRGRVRTAISGTALRIDIAAFAYRVGGSEGQYSGGTDIVVTNSATNYVELDTTGTVQINTSTWTSDGTRARLATVTCSGGVVTAISLWKPDVVGGQLGSSSLETVTDKTAGYSLLSGDSNKTFTNAGATISVLVFKLPAAAVGTQYSLVMASDAHLVLDAASGDVIKNGADNTNKFIYTKTKYSALRVLAIDSTNWVIMNKNGTWVDQDYAGFIVGGGTTSNFSNSQVISKLVFTATPTEANSSATLSAARGRGASANADGVGYLMGGYSSAPAALSSIRKIFFTDETDNAVTGALDATRAQGVGVQSSTKGYHVTGNDSGGTGITDVEDVVFADDTSTDIGVTVTAKEEPAGASSSTHGFWGGGRNGGSETSSFEKLLFSGPTVSSVSGTLGTARSKSAGCQSSTKGYIMTGSSGNGTSPQSAIDDIVFADDTSATLAATVGTARDRLCGVYSSSFGFCCGGTADNGSSSNSSIDDMDFSDDSSDTVAATLDTARQAPYGVSNPS